MNLKKLIDKILREEEQKTQHDFLKNLASQSYYFLFIYFKLKVLYNKEACDKNVWNHWYRDEFIGCSLKNIIFSFNGKITKEDIMKYLLMNFDNNYLRLVKDAFYSYKKIINKEDVKKEKIRELAVECYSRFADYILKNKEKLKDFKKEFFDELAQFIIK